MYLPVFLSTYSVTRPSHYLPIDFTDVLLFVNLLGDLMSARAEKAAHLTEISSIKVCE